MTCFFTKELRNGENHDIKDALKRQDLGKHFESLQYVDRGVFDVANRDVRIEIVWMYCSEQPSPQICEDIFVADSSISV